VFLPPARRKAEMLKGDPEEMVKEIVHRIRQAVG
jgi:hypothetical protein